jgi:hypothetical protein
MADNPTVEAPPGRDTDFLTYTLCAAAHAAEALLDDVPELRSVAVVFDWGVPLGAEAPPGVAIARKEGGGHEPARHPGGLHGLVRQTDRLSHGLRTRLAATVEEVNRLASTLAARVNEHRTELADLRKAIAAARVSLAAEAAGRDPAAALPDGLPADPAAD